MPKTPTTHDDKERKPIKSTTTEKRKDSKHTIKGSGEDTSRRQSPATSSTHHNHTMSSAASASSATTAAASPASDMTYYLIPNLQSLDPSASDFDAGAHGWVQPTVIEDDDLTFGGKSLSAWYEEDRRRLSHSDDEESRRGRERTRRNYDDKGRK